MAKSKPLYDTPVCKKCYYKFANRRQLAFIFDNLFFRLFIILVVVGVGSLSSSSGTIDESVVFLVDVLPYLLLPIYFLKDGFAGYSLGKLVCGVRVMNNKTGLPGGFGMSFLRNLPIVIPIVPLIIAFQLQKGPRWGDKWSNSKVIWMKYKDHPIFAPSNSI
jgi:uncharacterized RDD family membrane protein YckC